MRMFEKSPPESNRSGLSASLNVDAGVTRVRQSPSSCRMVPDVLAMTMQTGRARPALTPAQDGGDR